MDKMEISGADKKTMVLWSLIFLLLFFLALLLVFSSFPSPSGGCPVIGAEFARPFGWSFKASEDSERNDTTYATIELKNIGEHDLKIVLSGPTAENQILFRKPGASNCGWYGQTEIFDQTGKIQPNKEDSGYVTVNIQRGKLITIKGIISGPTDGDAPIQCGGQKNSTYRWSVTYSVILENESVLIKEYTVISGKYK
ncbi:MAG: hypothetical protein ABIG39_03710 [Candidatus Micrarchaeota archaeon]